MSMTSLGNRIKEAAEEIGGLKKLADELEVPRRTLGDWVSDSSEPKTSAIARISVITGVAIEWLILGVGPKFAGGSEIGDGTVRQDPQAGVSDGTIALSVFVEIDKVIRSSYGEHGGRASAQDFASLAVAWYNELIGAHVDLADAREVSSWIYVKGKELSRELISRRNGQPSSSKRPAS